jgi:hypothetical protein
VGFSGLSVHPVWAPAGILTATAARTTGTMYISFFIATLLIDSAIIAAV